MPEPFTVAAVQMESGPEVGPNLAQAGALLAEAAGRGAALAVLPENFGCMPRTETDRLEVAEADGGGPMQDFLAAAAARHGLWLVGGTVPVRRPGERRVAARCGLYDPAGRRWAAYDKIFLFDVGVPGTAESYRESATIGPGSEAVVAATPLGRLGLAVCYDVRFPELFRALLDAGAALFALPSAFTRTTGRAHWELLLRARAVENLAWVVAAAQCGRHASGRETWGHSMVVDPWGQVLADAGETPGLALAGLDPDRQGRLRRDFPALTHRRSFTTRDEDP